LLLACPTATILTSLCRAIALILAVVLLPKFVVTLRAGAADTPAKKSPQGEAEKKLKQAKNAS